MTEGNRPRVLIVSRSPLASVETFIRAHIEELPFPVVYLQELEGQYFSGTQNLRSDNGASTLIEQSLNLLPRMLEFRLRRRLFQPDNTELAARFIRDNRIDVVLAEYGTTAATIMPACRLSGVPLVAHFHGFDASRTAVLSAFAERYRALFDYAHSVIAVSTAMRDRLVELGCNPRKIHVTPCGPNPIFFDVEPDYSSNQILAVGRLTAKKAPHLTILAFARAAERDPSIELLVIGDGELQSVCRDLINAQGLSNRVRLAGAMQSPDIADAMSRSFLFVQHSVVAFDGDSEGTPVAVLEAGAAGLPVVSTRHGGIPEVIVDGYTGSIVDEFDVAAMGHAILQLANNRDAARKMGTVARERVRSEYSRERHLATVGSEVAGAARVMQATRRT